MAYDDIQAQIDAGRQQAANELGPPYNVFRLNAQDDTGKTLIAGNQIATSINIFAKVAYGAAIRTSLEAEKQQGIMWYDIIADMSPFLVGDVFVLNDPVYGAGYSSVNFSSPEFKGFALADHSPIKKSLGGRLNCCVTIFRPSILPNANGQWDKTLRDVQPVILNSGVFSLGSVGVTAAQIPAGLMAMGRSYGDKAFTQVPAEQRKSGWELYLPALDGFSAREGDKVIGPDGARYILIIPYTQKVGATGSQWFLEREASG